MRVVTFVTDKSHPHFKNIFVPSCRHNSLDLVVLGPPAVVMELENTYRRWVSRFGHNPKFRFLRKYKAMRKYLKGVPSDELLLFTDAYDTVMLADEDEIIEKYRSFDSPIVFSAEKPCHPPGNAYRFPASPTSLRYLNSGGYIGTAGALVDAYDRISASGYVKGRSDQLAWQKLYFACPDLIRFDYEAALFLCLAVGESSASTEGSQSGVNRRGPISAAAGIEARVGFDGRRAIFNETGQRPCQLHFNGKSRKLLQHEYMRPVTQWQE